jgi:hypothetical protein
VVRVDQAAVLLLVRGVQARPASKLVHLTVLAGRRSFVLVTEYLEVGMGKQAREQRRPRLYRVVRSS